MLDFKNNHDFLTLFENRLKDFTGAKYVILTDRCTNALFLSLEYWKKYKMNPVDDNRLIIPNRTYISVPQMLERSGFIPIFDNIKWVGSYQVGNTNIYDYAVQFHADMYKKDTVQCLSFQQKKAINIGKGGAILLDDEVMYQELKRMVHDGRDGSIPVHEDKELSFGYHMNMSPDEAAKGVLLLNQFDIEDNYRLNKDYNDYPDLSKCYVRR